MSAKNLSVTVGPLTLQNPVMTASGTFGYGLEYADVIHIDKLGAIILKGLSLTPSAGNPAPRVAETPCGMLNAIGLENIGIDAFIEKKLPALKNFSVPVITNIYGKAAEEYAELARKIDRLESVAAIEINISCPNVKEGGVAFGVDPDQAYAVTRMVRDQTRKPVLVKLSPNVTDITCIARKAEEAGADAVSLINTVTGLAIDSETRTPLLANITGGLSGPAIKPIALRMVWETARKVSIPVIGIGGITCATDAIEFIIAGATAIQVGTGNFLNPATGIEIVSGISAYLEKHDMTLEELRGSLKT